MAKKELRAKGVPPPGSIFSRGIVIANPKKLVFISGTCSHKGKGITEQTFEVYRNITALLKKAGASWDHVVRCLFFLRDIERDFAEFDQARRAFFKKAKIKPPYPASTGVQARLLRDHFLLELEVMAVID